MDEFINKVFEIIKDSLFKDIDLKYHDSMEQQYKYILKKSWENINLDLKAMDKNVSMVANMEKKKLINTSAVYRLQLYAIDSSFNELDKLSCLAYKYATARYNDEFILSEEDATQNIALMVKYIDDVYDFNKEYANHLLSEGIVDYNYASGMSNDISLRLAHNIKHGIVKVK